MLPPLLHSSRSRRELSHQRSGQVHDFEGACEDSFCNIATASYDGTQCESPPFPPTPPPPYPPPLWPKDNNQYTDNKLGNQGKDKLSTGAIIGIAVGAGLAVFLLIFVCFLVSQERKGTPVFSKIDATTPDANPVNKASAVA